jgi:hypothetical protein
VLRLTNSKSRCAPYVMRFYSRSYSLGSFVKKGSTPRNFTKILTILSDSASLGCVLRHVLCISLLVARSHGLGRPPSSGTFHQELDPKLQPTFTILPDFPPPPAIHKNHKPSSFTGIPRSTSTTPQERRPATQRSSCCHCHRQHGAVRLRRIDRRSD